MEFDYNKLLKDASGVLSSKNRTEDRLKVPEPEIIYEGKSTIIRNFIDITEMLNRNPEDLVKYFTKEFGIGASVAGRRLIINRKLREEEIREKLNAYMATYVLCYECSSPDTTIEKVGRTYLLVCKACGAEHPIKASREIKENEDQLTEGKTYTVQITEIGKSGEGHAFYGDFTIYVPGTKKGERPKVLIKKIRKNIAIGEVVK
ncbi:MULTISPECIES: translation initiation factor IF-2 subunit beta [Ferroplasma]|jgi:translation initiation factor 2 subunit 2|uniref:Translation initiation factor 2 subunit beta n=2 Tax=Ferroplasma TaxID=74968 RepID=S0ALQ2_FERAC|nr:MULTISPECIES: translation initiation factor IF-2 subunit beta [Ferroplasma]MCL4349131.1 translation initiation factor IF-2 subunit beta [Candidatus Thermoplasmatota archaeon]AGO60243.1 translation initiation factor IF-2 subunit beta [Ferroplasma acidarmanus Fer1]ARD85055.1 translation initiation factor IF-2 subunit beta [Ferroplasma acidiphilum]NOL60446.1 translation initiation factor IF-2 subunit beta [Ferroplasma acidiphilum]WMT53995.1 MAG: translation initiation factor IF-2 subunit beta 